jgi:hypothetical protein
MSDVKDIIFIMIRVISLSHKSIVDTTLIVHQSLGHVVVVKNVVYL